MLPVWLYLFFGLTTLVLSSTNSVFTNSFLVKFQQNIKNDIAHQIATRNGFENVGEVNIKIFVNSIHAIGQFLRK